jgi:N-acetyl-anhydromuramyl-L-alanine amidase AmpD
VVCEKIKSAVLKFFTNIEWDRMSREEHSKQDSKKSSDDRKNGVSLFYPKARLYTKHKTRGTYPKGYPVGAVIHYTASHGILSNEADFAEKNGYNYFIIDKQGAVAQLAPLNRWGYHAGASSAPGLDGTVSRHLVGIEVICAGKLSNVPGTSIFQTWWGETVDNCFIRQREYSSREEATLESYEMFTRDQEISLMDLLMWLKFNNPTVFDLNRVYGHNEVSPGRKVDPGLSINAPSMKAYRNFLETIYRNRTPSNKLV